jgi:AmmeMemoRadiSam system protein A
MTSPEVELARKTIESYIKSDTVVKPPHDIHDRMKDRAGVFVSIHSHGALRGCIGTFAPATGSIAEEIINNAISASTRDPRFRPIDESELGDLDISVDVLSKPEKVPSIKDLDPKKYGVIVESGPRKGLLLPDLEGVDTAEKQIEICKRKGGIADRDTVTLYRFEVKRYH